MIKWIQKVKKMLSVAQRLELIESQLNEIDDKIQKSMQEHSKQFEKKIQQMTFDYTKNLDDTKSDYLKRYLETRLNCIQQEISSTVCSIGLITKRIDQLQSQIEQLESKEDDKLPEDFN